MILLKKRASEKWFSFLTGIRSTELSSMEVTVRKVLKISFSLQERACFIVTAEWTLIITRTPVSTPVKKLAFLCAGFCFLLFKCYHHISVCTKPIQILFLCFFCNHDLNNARYKCWNRTWRKANKLTRCLISRQNQTELDYSDQDLTVAAHNSQILPQPTWVQQEGR